MNFDELFELTRLQLFLLMVINSFFTILLWELSGKITNLIFRKLKKKKGN